MPQVAVYRAQERGKDPTYNASYITKYEEALSKQMTDDVLQKLLIVKPSSKHVVEEDMITIQGVKLSPSALIMNTHEESLYVVSKHNQEFCMASMLKDHTDPTSVYLLSQLPKETVHTALAIGDWPHEGSSPAEHPVHFVRIPHNMPYIHVGHLYKHSDLPSMQLSDYEHIKTLLVAEDPNTNALGKALVKRWNPVTSFGYLIILAHIDKSILAEPSPLHFYLQHTSSGVSRTGFSGDLHIDAIDALMELNSWVLDGQINDYRSRKNGMLNFIMREYNVDTKEKSTKFNFKPVLKKK